MLADENSISVKYVEHNDDGSLLVVIDNNGEDLPYTAVANDTQEYGRALYEAAMAGKYGPIRPFPESRRLMKLRNVNANKRNEELVNADRVIARLRDERDVGVLDSAGEALFKAYVLYRRDLQKLDIEDEHPRWPSKPD